LAGAVFCVIKTNDFFCEIVFSVEILNHVLMTLPVPAVCRDGIDVSLSVGSWPLRCVPHSPSESARCRNPSCGLRKGIDIHGNHPPVGSSWLLATGRGDE